MAFQKKRHFFMFSAQEISNLKNLILFHFHLVMLYFNF